METRLQPGSESGTAWFAPRKYRRWFRLLTLASIVFLPGGIHAQDRPPARNPEHYTTTKTCIPSDPLAINDDGVVVGDNLLF